MKKPNRSKQTEKSSSFGKFLHELAKENSFRLDSATLKAAIEKREREKIIPLNEQSAAFIEKQNSKSRKDSKTPEETAPRTVQLKISLPGTNPLIWRRLLLAETTKLRKLHSIIQDVMGWNNTHLFEFIINDVRYAPKGDDGFESFERKNLTFTIGEALNKAKSFQYVYDFGDFWEHHIEVESITRRSKNVRLDLRIHCGWCRNHRWPLPTR